MGSLVLTGDTSGSGTINVPDVAGSFTATIGSATGTHYPFTSSTAASATGTSVTFSNIPSWVKRVTVMFQGVSLSGTDDVLVQIGTSGGIVSSGYASTSISVNNASTTNGANSTSGFIVYSNASTHTISGHMVITLIDSNNFVSSHCVKATTNGVRSGGGDVSLGGTLTQLSITRTGTNTFDAGTINILYE